MNARTRDSSYIFFLHRCARTSSEIATRQLRELGLRVAARYGDAAVEVFSTPAKAEVAFELGMFRSYSRGPISTEHCSRLEPAQREIASRYNARFSSGYLRHQRDRTHDDKPWGADGLVPSLPATRIDPEDFLEFWNETGRPQPAKKGTVSKLSGRAWIDYENTAIDRYGPELGYHVARLALRLDPIWLPVLLTIPQDVLDDLWLRANPEGCWELHREISVGIVFVESSDSDGPRFGATERSEIHQEIIDGFNLLVAAHPSGNLTFVYDSQFVKIDVANGNNNSKEAYWRNPAMAEVSYDGHTYDAEWASVAKYRNDMRAHNRSAHGIVVFVTPYGTEWHAYAGGGRLTLAKRNNWGGWGQSALDRITAHETLHLFGAADEYTGSGTPCSSCTTKHGCRRIPNGNCGACAQPFQACMMNANKRVLCAYTRGQIGWADIFVELRTSDTLWAGTDDTVWLDIGDQQFVLDTKGHDDRERRNVEGYALWLGGIERSEIKRILIRKSPDGYAGGWKLKRVRVWHAGDLICDRSPNRWLEDDERTYAACSFDADFVNTLTVKITTADVAWAGTDDDVTIKLAGRTWELDNPGRNDFERGRTDTFKLDPGVGLRKSDLHSVVIRKSPDGIAGGWKLQGVRIICNGTTVYNNQGINRWLEDSSRIWTGVI